jgi:hypothetical protein
MPPDPPEGGQSFLTMKFMGIPALVWVAVVAGVAYWLYSRNASSTAAAGSSSAGSSDTLTTGNTTVDTGAVSISIDASGNSDQPTPPVTGKATTVTVPNVVGKPGATALDQLKAAGFKTSQTPKTTPKGEATKVTTETPKAGTKVAKGSTVKTVVVANKKSPG